jgi:hypothetical protein
MGFPDPEDEWFALHEAELLRQARRERERKEREQLAREAEERRKLHWMKCPKCGADLRSETIQNVTIDRCADCGGIFLDRGELEELLLKDRQARRGFFRRLLGFD